MKRIINDFNMNDTTLGPTLLWGLTAIPGALTTRAIP